MSTASTYSIEIANQVSFSSGAPLKDKQMPLNQWRSVPSLQAEG
jgi:hypothetical protein